MCKKRIGILIFAFILLYVLQVSASITPMQSVPVETILQNFNTENTEYIHIPKTDSENKTNIPPESVSSFYKELFATQTELIQAPEDTEDNLTFFNFTPKGVRELTYNGNRRGFLLLENNVQVSYPYAIKYDDFMQIRNSKHISTTGFYVPKRLIGKPHGSGDGNTNVYYPTPDDIIFTLGENTYTSHGEKEIDSNPEIVPYIDADTERTMIPLRCLAEELDFSVEWNGEEQKVILDKNGFTVILYINSCNVDLQYEGITRSFETDADSVIRNDRTFVPVRFVAEAFGCQLHYDHSHNTLATVYITRETDESAASKIYTYPFISEENYEIGLKTYNTALKPYILGNQLNINIYDMDGKRMMTRTMERQDEDRRFVFTEPDVYSITMPELNRLINDTYYADIRFTPFDKTAYRIFFEVQ